MIQQQQRTNPPRIFDLGDEVEFADTRGTVVGNTELSVSVDFGNGNNLSFGCDGRLFNFEKTPCLKLTRKAQKAPALLKRSVWAPICKDGGRPTLSHETFLSKNEALSFKNAVGVWEVTVEIVEV